jgi:hypothetical protein
VALAEMWRVWDGGLWCVSGAGEFDKNDSSAISTTYDGANWSYFSKRQSFAKTSRGKILPS